VALYFPRQFELVHIIIFEGGGAVEGILSILQLAYTHIYTSAPKKAPNKVTRSMKQPFFLFHFFFIFPIFEMESSKFPMQKKNF